MRLNTLSTWRLARRRRAASLENNKEASEGIYKVAGGDCLNPVRLLNAEIGCPVTHSTGFLVIPFADGKDRLFCNPDEYDSGCIRPDGRLTRSGFILKVKLKRLRPLITAAFLFAPLHEYVRNANAL